MNYNYSNLIGKKIRIINLDGETDDRYVDREGVVEYVSRDAWNDAYLRGTWGGVSIYPGVDKFKIVEE